MQFSRILKPAQNLSAANVSILEETEHVHGDATANALPQTFNKYVIHIHKMCRGCGRRHIGDLRFSIQYWHWLAPLNAAQHYHTLWRPHEQRRRAWKNLVGVCDSVERFTLWILLSFAWNAWKILLEKSIAKILFLPLNCMLFFSKAWHCIASKTYIVRERKLLRKKRDQPPC